MKLGIEELTDRSQTGKRIYQCSKYFKDLGLLLDLSLRDFYDFVRRIPYKEDGPNEIVARPKYLIYGKKSLDCKKKAVLFGAWLQAHGISWRLVAVAENPDKIIHHVFIQALIDGSWKNIDATYPHYQLFEKKPQVTYAEELLR